jgi:hypothetical protein
MSTANGTGYITSEAALYGSISMLPTPCRMILVRVYQDEAGQFVEWEPIVGLLAYTRTSYEKRLPPGQCRIPPGSHAELVEAGYRSSFPALAIQPVYYDRMYGFIEAGDLLASDSNELRRAVVLCDWPPERDRENAIRIGKALMAETYDQERSAPLDEEEVKP